MSALFADRRRLDRVWGLLVGLTILSWAGAEGLVWDRLLAALAMAAAAVKGGAILLVFLGLNRSTPVWRTLFVMYLILLTGAVLLVKIAG